MSAVTFTYTGSLKTAGWSDFVPESAPDSNGVYWWDITKGGTTFHVASGNGYLSYDPSTGVFTFAEGTLSSATINGAEYWQLIDPNGVRLRFLKTAPFNGAPPTTGGGGGTSTEEVFVPDAKIVNYGGLTGFRFEQRGYPAASYELIGPGASSTWTLTSQTNNLQHHISNLSAGTYYLWQDSVQVATLIARTKVFCNFW